MVFCTNCGTEVKDDDLFCGNCGAKTNDEDSNNKSVNSKQQGLGQYINTSNINKEEVSKHSKEIWNIFKLMLIKPITSIKGISSEIDKKSTTILGVVLAVIQGIFSIWFLNHGISIVDKVISEIAGSSGIFSSIFSFSKENIELPYGQGFIHGIILSLVIFGVLYLGLYITSNVIFKTNTNSLALAKVVILSIIPALGGEFICLLVSYISPMLAIGILFLGIFISFATLLIGVKSLVNLPENTLIFSVSIIFTIMLGCVVFAVWKFILADVDSIKKSLMDIKNTKNSLMDIFK